MDEGKQAELTDFFGEWLREMSEWRAAHPKATLYEIEEYARTKRRELMGRVLKPLVEEAPEGAALCPECGERMTCKGEPSRQVETREAPFELERSYYHCPSCREGLFPPR